MRMLKYLIICAYAVKITRKLFLTSFVMFVAFGLIVAVALTGIPPADATGLQFSPAPGDSFAKIHYVPVNPASPYDEFKFWVTSPSSSGGAISVSMKPALRGLSLQKVGINEWGLNWITTSFASDSKFESRLFMITFVATDDTSDSTTISVPFLLFKEGKIGPTISLDKRNYLVGDTAYVTIYDPRADTDGNASSGSLEQVTYSRNPGGDFTISEVDVNEEPTVKSGTFRGSFQVTEPFTVSYDKYGTTNSISSDVSMTGVEFAREKYSAGQSAKIIATSATTSPTSITLNEIALPVTWISSSTSGRFETTVPLTVPGKNVISVSIDGTPYSDEVNVEKATAIFVNATSQDQQLTRFYSNDTAAIRVIDHQINQDPTKAEVMLSRLTVSTLLDSTEVPITLLETGIDTGIFTGTDLIGFGDAADAERKQVQVASNSGDSTDMMLRYTNDQGTITEKVEIITSQSEVIDPGMGPTSGSPVAASSLVTVTNLSCGSYGGDAERDGICDGWEAPTKTYLTIPYGGSNYVFSYACDPTCPDAANDDILLEIDYLSGSGPSANVLPDIKSKFSARGYELHYTIDEAFSIAGGDSTLNMWDDPGNSDCSGGYDSFMEIKRNYFGQGSSERLFQGTPPGCGDITNLNGKGAAKKQVWHYCLYGTTMKQSWSGGVVGTSGLSEEIGNDCVVSLGDFSPVDQNKEEGTLMHELGHNFGLRHGGGVNSITASPLVWIADSNANCKPNYISPMSYSHQFPNALGTVTLDYWTPSYSNYALTNYDVQSPLNSGGSQLDETAGPKPNSGTVDIAWVKQQGGSPNNKPISSTASGTADDVDWNGGGVSGLVWNNYVNDFGFRDCSGPTSDEAPNGVIRGFRDWNKLVLDMRVNGASNWNVPGAFSEPRELDRKVWVEILKGGIKVLNEKIQQTDDNDFKSSEDPDEIRAAFASVLIGAGSNATIGFGSNATGAVPSIFVTPSFSDDVVSLIDKGKIPQAIGQLLWLSKFYDGGQDGDADDDLIVGTDAQTAIFASTKGNIRTLSMELLEARDDAFGMSWTNENVFLVIDAVSPTINATDGRFFVHEKDLNIPSRNNITFSVQGAGNLTLYLDRGLVNKTLTGGHTLVYVDGNPVNATFTDSDIKLFGSIVEFSVPVGSDPKSPHEVVIMGSNVVPEFSGMATALVALAIMTVIILTSIIARSKSGSLSLSDYGG